MNDAWMKDGACRGRNQELWFPSPGGDPKRARYAKAICDQCPVLLQCREYAMADPDLQGIWGSMTATDRHFARQRRRRRAA